MNSQNNFIQEEWLKTIREGRFYYPSAFNDIDEAVYVFGSYIKEFTFCDINYPRGFKLTNALCEQDGYQLVKDEILGDPFSLLTRNASHRNIEPSWKIETYTSLTTMRSIKIIRRRGFGQYGLMDFSSRTLSVFMHRGDSSYEGGSNVFYLCDLPARHFPCRKLLSKVLDRLTDRAIILSDGSNIEFKDKSFEYLNELVRFRGNLEITCAEAYNTLKNTFFFHGGFKWECIGYMGRKNGPTIAWGLSRVKS